MASRKEQKQQLRKEREEREAAARASERRRRMIGLGAGGAVVLVAVVIGVVVLTGGGGDAGGGKDSPADVLPDGGEVPEPAIEDLEEAASAASCELEEMRATSREHTEDLAEQITYDSNPPTSGRHFAAPAEDGAYEQAPDAKELVHNLEHGRVIIWFKPSLPAEERASLNALFEEDTYHMVLVPNETRMAPAVAASAWNLDPPPNGTGRLLSCAEYSPEVFDALRAFKDEHRDSGPETVP